MISEKRRSRFNRDLYHWSGDKQHEKASASTGSRDIGDNSCSNTACEKSIDITMSTSLA
jgi:hypothetical protein